MGSHLPFTCRDVELCAAALLDALHSVKEILLSLKANGHSRFENFIVLLLPIVFKVDIGVEIVKKFIKVGVPATLKFSILKEPSNIFFSLNLVAKS